MLSELGHCISQVSQDSTNKKRKQKSRHRRVTGGPATTHPGSRTGQVGAAYSAVTPGPLYVTSAVVNEWAVFHRQTMMNDLSNNITCNFLCVWIEEREGGLLCRPHPSSWHNQINAFTHPNRQPFCFYWKINRPTDSFRLPGGRRLSSQTVSPLHVIFSYPHYASSNVIFLSENSARNKRLPRFSNLEHVTNIGWIAN